MAGKTVKSRRQYFNEKAQASKLVDREELHSLDRKIAHNLIEERSTLNMSGVVALGGLTTNVTYYYQIVPNDSEVNINPINQTSDNLVQYGCLRYLPLRFTEEINISDEGDEVLKSYITSGSAVILPNTILPQPNDYFTLEFNGRSYLYRIDRVALENTYQTPGRAVTFHIDGEYGIDFDFDKWPLNKNIVENKTFISKHLGTDFKPIITDSEIEDLDKLVQLYDELAYLFLKHFYDSQNNSFFMKYKNFDFDEMKYIHVNDEGDENLPQGIYNMKYNMSFYDALLVQFMKSNGVFNREKGRRVISPTHLMEVDFDDYDNSIYKAVEDRDLSKFNNRYFRAKQITRVSPYHSVALYNKIVLYHTPNKSQIGGYDFFPKDFINQLCRSIFDDPSETNYNSPSEVMVEIISLWINNSKDEDILKRLRLLRAYKESLVLSNVYPTNAFFLYPLIGYITNKVLENVFKNNNFKE